MNSLQLLLSSNFSAINITASLVAQMVKCLSTIGRPVSHPWVRMIPWRRKWQPTPVLLPGKSHGLRSFVGYSPWGRKESDMTERLHHSTTSSHFRNSSNSNFIVSHWGSENKTEEFPISYKTAILLFLNCVSTNTLWSTSFSKLRHWNYLAFCENNQSLKIF